MNAGWFGLASHVQHALATVNADRGDDGSFLITGAPVVVGLDDSEIVVPPETCYLVGGRPCSLAGLMNGTSYGVRGIVVI
jgi:hypothetical protein